MVCAKDICSWCYSMKTAETVHPRCRKVVPCFQHEQDGHLRVTLEHEWSTNCKGCNITPDYRLGVWKCDRAGGSYYCPDCEVPLEGVYQNALFEGGGSVPVSTFGSLLDWVPIIDDPTNGDRCYINMNADADQYGQLALSATDGHGRTGYFIVPGTLESIVQMMVDIQARLDQKIAQEDSSDSELNSDLDADGIISRILYEFGHETYYG